MLKARQVVELVLLCSAAALLIRNVSLSQPLWDLVLLSIVVGALVAPSFLLVHLTVQWKLWWGHVVTCLPWLPLGWLADLNCTDCGFALLIPLYMFFVQAALVAAGFVIPALRNSAHRSD